MSCQTNSNEFLNNALDALSNRISSLKSDVTTLQQNQIASNNLAVYLQNFTVTSDLLQNNWNTVGVIPSNITYRRVWEFSSSFNITSSSQDYTIVYDFSNVVSNYTVTFEGAPSGTISIGNQVFNANEYCTITQQGDILYFNLSGLPSGIKVGSQLSYIINFNDTTAISVTWDADYNTSTNYNSSNCPTNLYSTLEWYGGSASSSVISTDNQYYIYVTYWNVCSGGTPCYIWEMDTTWYTYLHNTLGFTFTNGETGITVNFYNQTSSTIATNSLQMIFASYTSNGTTYKINNGYWTFNPSSLAAGQSVSLPLTYSSSS